MPVSLSPTTTPAGQFSPLSSLINMALAELGESNPAVVLQLEQNRYLGYANRVVGDVNQHPYLLDIIQAAYTDFTADFVAGDPKITNINAAGVGTNYHTFLLPGTPLKAAGAGYNGGDLYTTVGIADSRGVSLQDAPLSSAVGATVTSPYKAKVQRYLSTTEMRPIDDQVLIDGIKHYTKVDDVDLGLTGAVNLYSTQYYQKLSVWLADLLGAFGLLTREIDD
jgi:hypothetical protein